MVKLIIKQAGHMITLPGLPPMRTPTEMNITKCKLNKVLLYLRTQGIDDYQIISERTEQKINTKKKEQPKKVKPQEDNTQITEQLKKIEKLLQIAINKEPTTIVVEQNNETIKKKKTKEKEPEFIPKMDFSGKITGNVSKEKAVESDSIKAAAEALKNLNK